MSARNDELLNALIASRTPKTNNDGAWAVLSFISLLILVAVGFIYMGGNLPTVSITQPTAQPAPIAPAPVYQAPRPVQAAPQVIPTVAPVVISQPVEVPVVEQAVQPVVVNEAAVKAQAILAQGKGPSHRPPAPAPSGAYALAPAFASGVLGPQPTAAPAFEISGVFK